MEREDVARLELPSVDLHHVLVPLYQYIVAGHQLIVISSTFLDIAGKVPRVFLCQRIHCIIIVVFILLWKIKADAEVF